MKKKKVNSVYYDMYENEESKWQGNKKIKINKKHKNRVFRKNNKNYIKEFILLNNFEEECIE